MGKTDGSCRDIHAALQIANISALHYERELAFRETLIILNAERRKIVAQVRRECLKNRGFWGSKVFPGG